ncbi:hypothetical protein [Aeromonas salmonicida]|uniref:hypothetical protein n=1 Tax=Aeromonas salmonicida TaxID=645 RepID=UPI00233026A1|nr:hypothetical protein [Aeromonas salmonicida]WCH25164.1 hypothetical protein ONZ54_23140 [Aeromonas salmonicida]
MRNAQGFAGAAAGSEFGAAVAMFDGVKAADPASMTEKAFFDSVTDQQMLDAVAGAAVQAARADAMAMVIEWVADGDDSAEGLDIYAQALADVDEDGEVTGDEEQGAYEQALTLMAEALATLGVPTQVAIDAMGGDDSAAAKAFVAAGDALGDVDADDTISAFAVRESMMMDAVVKVVRDGKLKLIRRPLRKKRLSAAQRAALKKARAKANTAASRTARRKSMRIRKSRGL